MGRRSLRLVRFALAALVCASCKESTLEDRQCPPNGTTLTYASFGAAFFGTYCQSCHGAPLDQRNGAPAGYDFGTREDIAHWRSRIFSRAAADNTTMPPGPDDPPAEKREQLAEWLACGAP